METRLKMVRMTPNGFEEQVENPWADRVYLCAAGLRRAWQFPKGLQEFELVLATREVLQGLDRRQIAREWYALDVLHRAAWDAGPMDGLFLAPCDWTETRLPARFYVNPKHFRRLFGPGTLRSVYVKLEYLG